MTTLADIREKLTEIIHLDQNGSYSSFCPEVPIASAGDTEEEASWMLADALIGFLECGGVPEWDAEKQRELMAVWCQQDKMVCVYDGRFRQ